MADECDSALLVAPLRETGAGPAPAFSVDVAIGRVRVIRRRRYAVLAAVAAAVVMLTAIAIPSRSRHHQQPAGDDYPVEAAHVSGTLWPVTPAQANELMAGQAPPTEAGDQLIAGTVTWTPPANGATMFMTMYLIDKRTGNQAAHPEPVNSHVTSGNDPYDDVIAHRYPWLSVVGAVHEDNGWGYYTPELSCAAALGRITFVARFPTASDVAGTTVHFALAPIDVHDLELVLVYHDIDGNGGWADRAYG